MSNYFLALCNSKLNTDQNILVQAVTVKPFDHAKFIHAPRTASTASTSTKHYQFSTDHPSTGGQQTRVRGAGQVAPHCNLNIEPAQPVRRLDLD